MVQRLLSLALLTCVFGWTQTPGSPRLQIPGAAQAGPQFNAQKATDAYLASLGPEKKARSDAYFEGSYWLTLWDFLFGAAVSLFLLGSGVSAGMRTLAERVTKRNSLVTFLYWAQYSIFSFAVGFPLAIYEGYFREHQYGLSNQTLAGWFTDELKSLALGIVLTGLTLVVLFAVVRRLGHTWHLWGAAVSIIFLILGMLLGPVFIAPLFNKYSLLQDARMREDILRIARQNGIPATNVYQVDASRQSKRVSANVSGFLGTERITLNDNLLNRCSPQAVLAVMGHEMGHYVLNHVYKMLAWMVIFVVGLFAALRKGLDWSLACWGPKWRLRGMGDPAILPLVVLLVSSLGFLFTPVTNTLVRTQEYEADMFGLNTAQEPDGFAEAALVLSEYRKLDPGPLEEIVFFDHPSGRTRIFSAMRWKAENQGQAHQSVGLQ
jgi:STE24 endopeptidase